MLSSPPFPSTLSSPVAPYVGEVVYIYAFDIAYEMTRSPRTTLLGQPLAPFDLDTSKRTPRQLFFYRAQSVHLPPLERMGPVGSTVPPQPLRLERSVKLLPVGAISITVRVPFAVERVEDLVSYHDLQFANGSYLYDEVFQLAEEVRQELAPSLIRPVVKLANEEAYTVFCFHSPPTSAAADQAHQSAEDWLTRNRRHIAAVLTQEYDVAHLSEQEALESTNKYLSYYDHDLVVIDWDAALIVDEPKNIDETLYLMELANLQLAELEAYDALLDDVIERSYRNLARPHPLLGYGTTVQRSLREIRLDMARLSDELSNSTKFFGDWHLARLYKILYDRFHLTDWYRTLDEKLKTLDDLYQLLQADRNNRMMLILEVTIVLLFIIDLVWLFQYGGK